MEACVFWIVTPTETLLWSLYFDWTTWNPLNDSMWNRRCAKHWCKTGTTHQKTHAALHQYWNELMPPSAEDMAEATVPHQRWPVPEWQNSIENRYGLKEEVQRNHYVQRQRKLFAKVRSCKAVVTWNDMILYLIVSSHWNFSCDPAALYAMYSATPYRLSAASNLDSPHKTCLVFEVRFLTNLRMMLVIHSCI